MSNSILTYRAVFLISLSVCHVLFPLMQIPPISGLYRLIILSLLFYSQEDCCANRRFYGVSIIRLLFYRRFVGSLWSIVYTFFAAQLRLMLIFNVWAGRGNTSMLLFAISAIKVPLRLFNICIIVDFVGPFEVLRPNGENSGS